MRRPIDITIMRKIHVCRAQLDGNCSAHELLGCRAPARIWPHHLEPLCCRMELVRHQSLWSRGPVLSVPLSGAQSTRLRGRNALWKGNDAPSRRAERARMLDAAAHNVPISWVMKSPACANMASDLAVDHKDSSPLAADRSQASRLVGGSAQRGHRGCVSAFEACRRKAKPVEQCGPVSVVTRCGVLSAVIRPGGAEKFSPSARCKMLLYLGARNRAISAAVADQLRRSLGRPLSIGRSRKPRELAGNVGEPYGFFRETLQRRTWWRRAQLTAN